MRRESRPLEQRGGVDATRVRLPTEARWHALRDYLSARFGVSDDHVAAKFRAGDIADETGPITADAPFVPGGMVWIHRELPAETPVPFDMPILHQDEHLVVVDKPHFLATTPRGQHVAETALVRLRRQLELPDLVAAHRLDRMTAGVLLFVRTPEQRGRYQRLFQNRLVHKEYRAIAGYDSALGMPCTVRSRLIKPPGMRAATRGPGPTNSETRVELVEHQDGLGHYRLLPRTGRTHQLRAHLYQLGIPILGDDLYPEVAIRPADDFTQPLQLLASALEFTDPNTGEQRRFESRRALLAWTDHASWVHR